MIQKCHDVKIRYKNFFTKDWIIDNDIILLILLLLVSNKSLTKKGYFKLSVLIVFIKCN